MQSHTYLLRRRQLTTYFDRTATTAWKLLTSDAPVNRIRQTVRSGRDTMRANLLGWLPEDLTGMRILDAGCGTGALTFELAKRGAQVVAIDVAGNLIDIARQRMPSEVDAGQIDFIVGDMCSDPTGDFDYVVAMDSLIHYSTADIVAATTALSRRASRSVLFTFAPRTLLLAAMHCVGRLVPHRNNRAPSIVPTAERRLVSDLEDAVGRSRWQIGRMQRVDSGFYISQALELTR